MTVETIASGATMSLAGPWVDTWAQPSTGNRALIGMSKDRSTLYARGTVTKTAFIQSVDDGVTWTDIRQFAEAVEGMTFTDDGEVLIITQGGSSTPGYIYKSSGWTTANPTAATWTKVFTTRGGYIRSVWGAHRWSSYGSRIVTCEYGTQSQSADATTAPTKYATAAYLSEDYGATWRQILDLTTQFPGTYGFHCHAIAYDPYWDRIWVTYGDVATHLGGTGTNILYSDDLGQTWTTVPLPPAWTGQSNYPFQDTTIFVTEKCVGFMPDGVPYSPNILPRKGYRVMGDLMPGPLWAGATGAQGISYCAYKPFPKTGKSTPLFLSNQGISSQYPPAQVLMSPDGHGAKWVEIYRMPAGRSSVDTIDFVVGPTANDYVLFSQAANMWRAKLLKPLTDTDTIS